MVPKSQVKLEDNGSHTLFQATSKSPEKLACMILRASFKLSLLGIVEALVDDEIVGRIRGKSYHQQNSLIFLFSAMTSPPPLFV
jgi:hypothetical protein